MDKDSDWIQTFYRSTLCILVSERLWCELETADSLRLADEALVSTAHLHSYSDIRLLLNLRVNCNSVASASRIWGVLSVPVIQASPNTSMPCGSSIVQIKRWVAFVIKKINSENEDQLIKKWLTLYVYLKNTIIGIPMQVVCFNYISPSSAGAVYQNYRLWRWCWQVHSCVTIICNKLRH